MLLALLTFCCSLSAPLAADTQPAGFGLAQCSVEAASHFGGHGQDVPDAAISESTERCADFDDELLGDCAPGQPPLGSTRTSAPLETNRPRVRVSAIECLASAPRAPPSH